MKRLTSALLVIAACGSPSTEDGPRHGFSPISAQGTPAQTSFAGVVDPTVPSGPAGSASMQACNGSCSSALAEQNRAALQATIDYASSHNVTVYIPPGQYPIGCASGQPAGVDFAGDSNVTISGWNVTLRFTGDQASADCAMIRVRNSSHVKIQGITFSQRDVTNTTISTLAVKIGDGGTTSADDVAFEDVAFVEGLGGDYVRLDGGTASVTVNRVRFERSRFEGSARAGIDVRPGVQKLNIVYNFFRSNANRDVWLEDTGDGPIGQFTISGNMFERVSTATAQAVTLSGHGVANVQEQSSFTFNRIIYVVGVTSNGGGVVDGSGLAKTLIAYNTIITDRSTSTPSIALTGSVTDVWVSDNFVDRRAGASNAAVIQVASDGTSTPTQVLIRGNRVLQHSGIAPGIDASGCSRCTVSENSITYHVSTADSGATGFAGVYCAGSASSCSGVYAMNRVKRDDQDVHASLDLSSVTPHDNTVLEAVQAGRNGNNLTVSLVGDSGSSNPTATGTAFAVVIHFKPAATTVSQVENLISSFALIRVKTPGTGSTILQTGDALAPTALSGGVQAGRPLACVEVLKGSGTTVGRLALRDNWCDGAKDQFYVDADGSAQWPEGYPLISGNAGVSNTNEFEGGVTTYRAETTLDAETISTGAAAIAKRMTFITTANTAAYTLADGVADGLVHCFKIKSTSGTPNGTMTPTHLADGTTHTITWSAAGGFFCLAWDATSTTYRVVGSSGVTVN